MRHKSSRRVCSVCAPSSRSCISKDIIAALHGTRGSLTACVYRRLYLARAITSPSATDRTNERMNEQASKEASEQTNGENETSRAESYGSISNQPVTSRPRSHGVYIPSHSTRYPVRSLFFHGTVVGSYRLLWGGRRAMITMRRELLNMLPVAVNRKIEVFCFSFLAEIALRH